MVDKDVEFVPADPFSSTVFSAERSTFKLHPDELARFNTFLNSQAKLWRIVTRQCYELRDWQPAVHNVLLSLLVALGATHLRTHFLQLSPEQISEFVENLTVEELEDWKNAVQKGLNEENWADAVGTSSSIMIIGG